MQFARQSSRPLTAASYAAAVKRMDHLLRKIIWYSDMLDNGDPRGKQQLTRAIHGLSMSAQNLSRRHRARSVDHPHRADAYDAAIDVGIEQERTE
jgi:hypothetical protein